MDVVPDDPAGACALVFDLSNSADDMGAWDDPIVLHLFFADQLCLPRELPVVVAHSALLIVWLRCLSTPHHWARCLLSPRSPEHLLPHVGHIFCVSSSCFPPSHVRIALMAVSFKDASHTSHSSEGLASIGSTGALLIVSSASGGSIGCRNLSALGSPLAHCLRASHSKAMSLLSCSKRAVRLGSSLSSSKESRPKQTSRGRIDVSWRLSFTTHGRSSFL